MEVVCCNEIRKGSHEEYRRRVKSVSTPSKYLTHSFLPNVKCYCGEKGENRIEKGRKAESERVVRRKVKGKRKWKLGEGKRKEQQGLKVAKKRKVLWGAKGVNKRKEGWLCWQKDRCEKHSPSASRRRGHGLRIIFISRIDKGDKKGREKKSREPALKPRHN